MLSLLFLFATLLYSFNLPFHGRFNPAVSFSAPFEDELIPGWSITESTVVTRNSVRLTPDTTSRKGAIWSNIPNSMSNWEIELEFKAGDGSGIITGADGLAFWYTATPEISGTVFGSEEFYSGLGIILDSFDNNNDGQNPRILAVQNDGTQSFDHDNDGGAGILDSCQIDYRSLGSSESARLRITYDEHRNLRVWVDLNPLQEDWVTCIHVSNVILPLGYYFGVSAATGGISDQHEVFRFESYSLNPRDPLPSPFPGQSRTPHGPVFAEESEGVLSSIKHWFAGDDEDKRAPDRSRPFRSMEDILTKVEEEEMQVKKNRFMHMSAEQRADSIGREKKWDRMRKQMNSMIQEESLEKHSGDENTVPFKREDHRILVHLQEVVSLQTKVLAQLTTQLESVASRDEVQALHALILQTQTNYNEETEKRLSSIHDNIKENMNQIHSRVSDSVDYTKSAQDRQELILSGLKRNRQELSQTIEKKSGSGSIWFLFILFQVVFASAFYFWKQYREEFDKKMF